MPTRCPTDLACKLPPALEAPTPSQRRAWRRLAQLRVVRSLAFAVRRAGTRTKGVVDGSGAVGTAGANVSS